MTALHIISILIAFILGALVFWLGMKYQVKKSRNKLLLEIKYMESKLFPEKPYNHEVNKNQPNYRVG